MSARGIRTFEDIRQRCYVDEATGCWVWRGATTQGNPAMWLPDLGRVCVIGAAISWLRLGVRRTGRLRWMPVCGDRLCCNPEHRRQVSHSRLLQSAGMRRTPEQVLKCRAAATRYPDELVAAIRADSGTLKEIGDRHGVSKSYASRVRRQSIRPVTTAIGALVRTLTA